jgi:hypothetical protein
MRSDRPSLTGWGRWDSGSTVRTGHAGRAQEEGKNGSRFCYLLELKHLQRSEFCPYHCFHEFPPS